MTLYLLTCGEYSDYSMVDLVVSNKETLDMTALGRKFAALYDHGETLEEARCWHPEGIVSDCVHAQARAKIRAWRREQGWPDTNVIQAFIVWLVQTQGCAVLPTQEVNLSDENVLWVGRPRACIRVTYDPTYNGDGTDYPLSRAPASLRTALMPVSLLRTWGTHKTLPPREQIGRWLESTMHLSPGNLVSFDLETLYDQDGNKL